MHPEPLHSLGVPATDGTYISHSAHPTLRALENHLSDKGEEADREQRYADYEPSG